MALLSVESFLLLLLLVAGASLMLLLLEALLGDRNPSPSIPPRDQGLVPFAGVTGLGPVGMLLLVLLLRVIVDDKDAADDVAVDGEEG